MSFFQTSNGQQVETTGSFNADEGSKPIPNNTVVMAYIEECKWESSGQDDGLLVGDHIKAKWKVCGEDYKNRVIFQKIRVTEQDTNKRDKALKMLAAIDANCGGALMASGEQPTDQSLMAALTQKPMLIKLKVWSITDDNTGEIKEGNWVSAVSNASNQGQQQQQPVQQQQQPQTTKKSEPEW